MGGTPRMTRLYAAAMRFITLPPYVCTSAMSKPSARPNGSATSVTATMIAVPWTMYEKKLLMRINSARMGNRPSLQNYGLLGKMFDSQLVNETFILQLLDDLIDGLLKLEILIGNHNVDGPAGQYAVIDDLQPAKLLHQRLRRDVIGHHHFDAAVLQVEHSLVDAVIAEQVLLRERAVGDKDIRQPAILSGAILDAYCKSSHILGIDNLARESFSYGEGIFRGVIR